MMCFATGNKDFGFFASEGPDGRTFSSLRPSALRGVQHVTICTFQFRRPTRYDLHVSILQELFVVHLLFSLSWNVSPGFGSEKLRWFGVRGGWPPQYHQDQAELQKLRHLPVHLQALAF